MNFAKMPIILKDCARDVGQGFLRASISQGEVSQKKNQLAIVVFSSIHVLAQHVQNLKLQNNMTEAEAILYIREAIESEVEYLSDESSIEPEFYSFYEGIKNEQ